jgi:glycosyltransferase involved in cell wall biosynthesis
VVTRQRRSLKVGQYFGLRRATRVQALTADVERELIEAGVDRDSIVRIPNGVDLDGLSPPSPPQKRAARQRLGLPLDQPILLFAGRFARYKGALDLVEAWPSINRGEAELVMLGTFDTEDSIGSIPARDGLTVRPWTTAPEDYLRAADVFVHPSHADGMSNAVLEAMAMGLPVLHAASGASAGFLSHGADGLLFACGDRRALGAAIERVLSDAQLRSTLGDAARRRARDFSLASVVDRIVREYERLLDRDLSSEANRPT